MTDTTCPSCDAPAPAGARSCARCGYRFLEAGQGSRERPSLRPVALCAGALAVAGAAAVLAVGALGGGDGDAARSSEPQAHLDMLSEHPISHARRRAAPQAALHRHAQRRERLVRCSGRLPKPAHSVRRCLVHYPGGIERRVILLTTANGAELIEQALRWSTSSSSSCSCWSRSPC